jgi:hypothetical protein
MIIKKPKACFEVVDLNLMTVNASSVLTNAERLGR